MLDVRKDAGGNAHTLTTYLKYANIHTHTPSYACIWCRHSHMHVYTCNANISIYTGILAHNTNESTFVHTCTHIIICMHTEKQRYMHESTHVKTYILLTCTHMQIHVSIQIHTHKGTHINTNSST